MHTRTLSDILQDTANLMQKRLVGFLITAVIGTVPNGLVALAIGALVGSQTALLTAGAGRSDTPTEEQMAALLSLLPLAPVFVLVGCVAAVVVGLTHLALVQATAQAVEHDRLDPAEAWKTALSRAITAWAAGLLVGVAVILMAITIIGIPFAFYFGVRWSFLSQAVVLDGAGPRAALSRSSDLVHGQWWRVLGISLVIGLITGIASTVLGALNVIPVLGAIAASTLAAPLSPIAQTLLYYDLRARKDGTPAPNPQ